MLGKLVFNHGQLYVTFFRVTHPDGLKVLALDEDVKDSVSTTNGFR